MPTMMEAAKAWAESPPTTNGWVYVIWATGRDCFKIGFTTQEPSQRLAELQTGCPDRLVILTAFWCKSPRLKEQALHAMLDESGVTRAGGEWFEMPFVQMLDCLMHYFAGILNGLGAMRFWSPEQ